MPAWYAMKPWTGTHLRNTLLASVLFIGLPAPGSATSIPVHGTRLSLRASDVGAGEARGRNCCCAIRPSLPRCLIRAAAAG